MDTEDDSAIAALATDGFGAITAATATTRGIFITSTTIAMD